MRVQGGTHTCLHAPAGPTRVGRCGRPRWPRRPVQEIRVTGCSFETSGKQHMSFTEGGARATSLTSVCTLRPSHHACYYLKPKAYGPPLPGPTPNPTCPSPQLPHTHLQLLQHPRRRPCRPTPPFRSPANPAPPLATPPAAAAAPTPPPRRWASRRRRAAPPPPAPPPAPPAAKTSRRRRGRPAP